MAQLRKSALAAFIVLTAITAIAMGQGPLHKRVNYTINVSHSLRMGDYMLPPGKYVIYQINQNDTNLFALYQNDLTESPVAMIRTTRVEYRLGRHAVEDRHDHGHRRIEPRSSPVTERLEHSGRGRVGDHKRRL